MKKGQPSKASLSIVCQDVLEHLRFVVLLDSRSFSRTFAARASWTFVIAAWATVVVTTWATVVAAVIVTTWTSVSTWLALRLYISFRLLEKSLA